MPFGMSGTQGDDESTPTSIVAPWNMDIDPSTMQVDPVGYMNMLGDGLKQAFNSVIPASQPSTPGAFDNMQEVSGPPPSQRGPIQGIQEIPGMPEGYTPHPKAEPLIQAIEHGYADKAYMNPVKMIRDGVKADNHEMIEKGHTKLTEMLSETHLSPMDKFLDFALGRGVVGNAQRNAQKIAADVIAHELSRPGSTAGPGVEESVRIGLIKPNELLPGSQLASPGIPGQSFAYGSDGGEGMSAVQTQGSDPQYTPGAVLTPQQEAIATSRQHGISTGTAYRMANSSAQADLAREKAATERYKREYELPGKLAANRSLELLRSKQGDLYQARTEYTRQLPRLRRELQGGSNPFELDALKRVHASILKREPIEKADWMIAQKWLTKGTPQFGLDFMGRTYNKFTGESQKDASTFKGLGIPEPPDTAFEPEQHAEGEAIHDDMAHNVGKMLGSLLNGITGKEDEGTATKKPKGDAKVVTKAPEVKLPTPKTPAEAKALKPGTKYLRPDGKMAVR